MTEAAVTQQQRYTVVAIALHWLIAAGIIGMIALGWIMDDVPDAQAYSLIQLHKCAAHRAVVFRSWKGRPQKAAAGLRYDQR